MISEGLEEMFEGDSADMCAGKYLLGLMGGRAEGPAYSDLGARTHIGASGNLIFFLFSPAVTKIQEGVVLGFRNFAWAPK
jgi:hypothetical protein